MNVRGAYAAGVEARHERQHDDRDPHLDGAIIWNQLSGGVQQSDQYGISPTLDIRGLDFGINWSSADTRIGRFTLSVNGNRLLEYYREVPAEIQALFDAGDAGIIDPSVTLSIAGYGDRIMRYGKVRWKWTGNLFWDYGNFQLGTTGKYVSDFYDTGMAYDSGFWQPGSSMYWNAFAKYNFTRDGWWAGTSIKIGANNLDNCRPPRAADAGGYLATIYTPHAALLVCQSDQGVLTHALQTPHCLVSTVFSCPVDISAGRYVDLVVSCRLCGSAVATRTFRVCHW